MVGLVRHLPGRASAERRGDACLARTWLANGGHGTPLPVTAEQEVAEVDVTAVDWESGRLRAVARKFGDLCASDRAIEVEDAEDGI